MGHPSPNIIQLGIHTLLPACLLAARAAAHKKLCSEGGKLLKGDLHQVVPSLATLLPHDGHCKCSQACMQTCSLACQP